MQDDVYDGVVRAVYGAATGVVSWQQALDQMCAAFDGWNTHLMGLDKANGVMLFSFEGGAPPPQGTLDYIRTWHRCDPRAALVVGNPPGKWFHCHEHFDERHVQADPFYRDFLIPYGMRYASGMRFEAEPGLSCVLSVSRGVGQAPLDEDERRMLDRIGVHITEAFRLQAKVKKTMRVGFAGYAVLQRLKYPIFVMDEQRVVLFSNDAAKQLLASGGVAVREGVLRLRSRGEDMQFTGALKAAMLGESVAGAAAPHFVRITESLRGSPALVHLSVSRPEQEMGAFGPAPTVIATFFLSAQENRLDPYVVAAAFDLTPAEARVATFLAEGEPLKRIASRLGVTVNTARAQLRSVFQKVGVKRQADLAQLLSRNPAFWAGTLVRTDP